MGKFKKATLYPNILFIKGNGSDSHAHISEYFDDPYDVVERAIQTGITLILDVLLSPYTRVFKHEILVHSLGIPPQHASRTKDIDLENVFKKLQTKEFIALGEVGLCFARNPSKEEKILQEEVFRKQLDFARILNLPVIIHARRDNGRAVKILEEEGFIGKHIQWHCFDDTIDLAKKAVNNGWYISLSGVATRKDKLLEQIIKSIPKENILLETDSPYLAPGPWRGFRAEPSMTAWICKKIASIKNITYNELWELSTHNLKTFLDIKE